MKYLFSDTGQRLLESLTFTKTLYAFDFDGTLAPIVSHPAGATVPQRTQSLLASVEDRIPCAVISGRSISDLRKHLEWQPRYLIGNHGLEGLPSQRTPSDRVEEICSRWKKSLSLQWPKRLNDSGVFIEDKTYSLALHYRRSRNKKAARRALLELAESLEPSPRLILGKSVINLLPPGAPHKGVAVLELMLHLGAKSALYIGDDDTDEDVFSLPEARILTVRVGYKKSSQAQFFIKRQSEVNRLLSALSRYLLRGVA